MTGTTLCPNCQCPGLLASLQWCHLFHNSLSSGCGMSCFYAVRETGECVSIIGSATKKKDTHPLYSIALHVVGCHINVLEETL